MKNKDKIPLCERCNKNPASEEPHVCPYANDVYNDSEFECNCCIECERECAADI